MPILKVKTATGWKEIAGATPSDDKNSSIYVQEEEPVGADDGTLWVDLNEDVVGSTTKAVLYEPQELTEEQKAQARENIGLVEVEPAEDDIPKVFINGTIPTTKDEALAEMQYISETETFNAYLKIKCQGNSSMSFPKKNFTVKLYSDEAREIKLKKMFKDWGYASNKFVLKANYVDHSHARNIICANLWSETIATRADYDTLPVEMRNSPRNGAIDGFPIKVYTNGTYQGIYTWNIGKDDWMWGMNEDNPNHVLLCAETNSTDANPCNFSALWSGVNEEHWSVEVGTNSDAVKNSLNALISCVMDTDDATFKTTIGNYLDVQSAIDYIIHCTFILGQDNVAKNMLLATYDGVKWYCGAYDMDGTVGLTSGGEVNDPSKNWLWNEGQLLWKRIIAVFGDELKERYAFLKDVVYSYGNMVTKFERLMDNVGKELYMEDLEIYPGIPNNCATVKCIRDFIRDREQYVERDISGILYPFVNGTHTFDDGQSVTVVNSNTVTLTYLSTDTGFPCINISNVTQNSGSIIGDNHWHRPTLFDIKAGDEIRAIVEADGMLYFDLGLASTSDYVKMTIGEWGWSQATRGEVTIIADQNFSAGAIVVTRNMSYAPNKTITFTVKIYVNGVRYV